MGCNIILQVLPRDMMRWKRSICESCIREAHRYVWYICSVANVSFWVLGVPCLGTYVKELYTGVLEYRSCSTGAVTLGSWSGILTGGSICGGSFPGFMGSSGPGDASNILFDVSLIAFTGHGAGQLGGGSPCSACSFSTFKNPNLVKIILCFECSRRDSPYLVISAPCFAINTVETCVESSVHT